MSNPDNIELVRKVDQLGYLKAQISDLEKQAKALAGEVEAALLRGGDDFYDGQLFRAVLVRSERESVDWKAVAERLEPSRQLVRAYTKVVSSQYVKINARKKNAA